MKIRVNKDFENENGKLKCDCAFIDCQCIDEIKKEVAREMLGEIDFVFKTMKMEIETHIGEAILENDLSTASSIQYGKDVICLAEKVLFEALKKYIGE